MDWTATTRRRIGLAGIVAALLGAIALSAAPARADDFSIAMPGLAYYTPPPAYHYGFRYSDYPVIGGVYLGFGRYHHHHW